MNLYGWKYEGRKISDKLHEQILEIIEILNDPNKVNGNKWRAVQTTISNEIGVTTGQVRTIKRMMEEFKILKKGSLNAIDIPEEKNLYTSSGRLLVDLLATEKLMKYKPDKGNHEQIKEIKDIYKLYYQKVLAGYCYNDNGYILHPLRATLKAIKKFGYLDYWEWYILNTTIRQDDDKTEEEELETSIKNYRDGLIKFDETSIKENTLSHSYVLGNFKYAGFVCVTGTKEKIKITLNKEEEEIIKEIIK